MPLFAKKEKEIKPVIKTISKPVLPIVDEDIAEDVELDDINIDEEPEKPFQEETEEQVDGEEEVPVPEYSNVEENKIRLMNLILRKMEIDEQLKNKRIIEKTDITQMGLKTEYMLKRERNELMFVARNLAQELFDSGVTEKEINEIEKKPWID